MSRPEILNCMTLGWFVLAAFTFIALQFVVAPYGRHIRRGWGPTLPNRLGWLVMELPMVLVFGACFAFGQQQRAPAAWLLLMLWEAHYLHRVYIYPFTLRGARKRMPLMIVAMGFFTNILLATMNGYYLFGPTGGYLATWFETWRFRAGVGLFVVGFTVNRQSDAILRQLRRPGESGYRIPQGGLYRWVSCPNYLGEIVEWLGWAVATWSLPGLAFAVWTIANLVPRARAHHVWYRQQFPDYPPERKALLPGVW